MIGCPGRSEDGRVGSRNCALLLLCETFALACPLLPRSVGSHQARASLPHSSGAMHWCFVFLLAWRLSSHTSPEDADWRADGGWWARVRLRLSPTSHRRLSGSQVPRRRNSAPGARLGGMRPIITLGRRHTARNFLFVWARLLPTRPSLQGPASHGITS